MVVYLVDEDPAVSVCVLVRQHVDAELGLRVPEAVAGAGRPPEVPGVDGPLEPTGGLHPEPRRRR